LKGGGKGEGASVSHSTGESIKGMKRGDEGGGKTTQKN